MWDDHLILFVWPSIMDTPVFLNVSSIVKRLWISKAASIRVIFFLAIGWNLVRARVGMHHEGFD
jgi:hypothetical protein